MWQRRAYFAFRLPDRPGELVNLLAQLADAGINLVGLWGYAPGGDDGAGGARVSCVPESAAAFRTFFRSADVDLEEGLTFHYDGRDRPGALVHELRRISDAGVNLHTIECVGAGGHFGCFVWADARDWASLDALLAAAA